MTEEKKKVVKKRVRKKPNKKASFLHVKIIDGVEHPCVSEIHLLSMELFHQKMLACREGTARRYREAEKEEAMALAKVRALRIEAGRMERELEEVRDDHKRFMNKLSTEYRVDFAKVSYDSNTGILDIDADAWLKKENNTKPKSSTAKRS